MFCAQLSVLLLYSDVIVFPKMGTVAGKEMLAVQKCCTLSGTVVSMGNYQSKWLF